MIGQRLLSMILTIALTFSFSAPGMSKNMPKLNIQGHGFTEAELNQRSALRSFNGGKMTYRIPAGFAGVEISDEDKADIFNVDAADCNAYILNGLTGQKEAEVLCMFFFNFDKYLSYETDSKETTDVEYAIINNIDPAEVDILSRLVFSPISYQTAEDGRIFNNYVATYGSHRVEFVFTAVEGGMCVLMYIYNDGYNYVDDILYIMHSISEKGE